MPRATDDARERRISPQLAAGVVGAALIGAMTRAWVLVSPFGAMNADEAYTGLQAADILGGRLPVVIQGSTYSAVLECYLFAPLVAVFGQHVVPLKLIGVLGWALASVMMVITARRLLGARSGWVAAGLLWLAPGAMTIVSTRAYVGYATGMGLVVASIWACSRVLDAKQPPWGTSALAGALCGLAAYVHPMFLTVVIPMLAVTAAGRWRSVRSWWVPATSGFVAANGPLLIWNVLNGWPSFEQPVAANDTYTDRFLRFFTGLMPRALGVRAQEGAWIGSRPTAIALFVVILVVVAAGARELWRHGPAGRLVVVPLLTCWPLMAMLANLSFVIDARYAVIPLPFVVLALSASINAVHSRSTTRWRSVVAPTALTLWLAVFSVPALRHDLGTSPADPNIQTATLITELKGRGFDRIAGYYWLVLPIEYQSDRTIRSAVAGFPYLIRTPTSQRMVEQASPEAVAFVFDRASDDPSLLRMPQDHYERVEVAGAILYLPRAMSTNTTGSH